MFFDAALASTAKDSFVEGSLDVRGHGQILTSTASFSDLRFSVKIQAAYLHTGNECPCLSRNSSFANSRDGYASARLSWNL